MNLIDISETGLIPDWLIRVGIRRLLSKRLATLAGDGVSAFAEELRRSPLAVDTDAANRQHYEVPAEFFELVLGPRLKYSACLFPSDAATLAEAEEHMLRETCRRAEIKDGMSILELGCGWGSLSLWMAEQYPNCRITAVSNSSSQRRFIEDRAQRRRLHNIDVITADIRDFASTERASSALITADLDGAQYPARRSRNWRAHSMSSTLSSTGRFDRVVSVEMFEHMRNLELLFERISRWLAPGGKAFAHIFCHRDTPYLFETDGATNWMGRHFFTGGMMPSEGLFRQFSNDLTIEKQWRVSGLHYWRTCEAWLQNLDRHRVAVLARLLADLPHSEAKRNLQRWRIFFMACAELFRFRGGNEWFVAQYLFQPTHSPRWSQTKRMTTSSVS